jgi:hypothetical protein
MTILNPSLKGMKEAYNFLRAKAFKMKRKGIPGYSFFFCMARHVKRIVTWLESGCSCTIAGCDCYHYAYQEERDKSFRNFEQQLYEEWFKIVESVTIFCEKHGIPVQ